MSLDNISYCRYLADIRYRWTQENYDVAKIVRAIKEESFKGYADLRVGKSLVRLDPDHRRVATDWFVNQVATETDFSGGIRYLCPIPDSQCTPTSTHASRTLVLAEQLSQRIPQLKVWPHLKFCKPMPRKIRDEELLFSNMVLTARIPNGYVILLDDVCTTGAHARAAQRRLVENGAGNMCAMSVARTLLEPADPIFGYLAEAL
jgi:hypothetical protein